MKAQHVVLVFIVLVLAWLVFLAAESHGRILETRTGLIVILLLAGLCFAGAFLTRKKTDDSAGKKGRRLNGDDVIDIDSDKK